MENIWYVKSRVPGTDQIRVSWKESGEARTHTFPNARMADGWIKEKMKKDAGMKP